MRLSRHQQRRRLRLARNSLSHYQQKFASLSLYQLAKTLNCVINSTTFAFYIANDGEIDPKLLVKYLQHLGKKCYLPVIRPNFDGRLWFIHTDIKTKYRKNKFGMVEPCINYQQKPVPAWAIDVVFVPLVGFDPYGQRLGMGGGYYDKTFGFKNIGSSPKQPMLIGLAHEVQKVQHIENKPWDIPLDLIITDKATYHVHS